MVTNLTQDDYDSDEAIFVLEYFVVASDMQVVLDKLMKAMRSPILSNDDLPQIANGTKNDLIKKFFSFLLLLRIKSSIVFDVLVMLHLPESALKVHILYMN